MGGILLPFILEDEMSSENPAKWKFAAHGPLPIRGECRLCFDSLCEHGSKCEAALETYSCDCTPGYEGQRCQVGKAGW